MLWCCFEVIWFFDTILQPNCSTKLPLPLHQAGYQSFLFWLITSNRHWIFLALWVYWKPICQSSIKPMMTMFFYRSLRQLQYYKTPTIAISWVPVFPFLTTSDILSIECVMKAQLPAYYQSQWDHVFFFTILWDNIPINIKSMMMMFLEFSRLLAVHLKQYQAKIMFKGPQNWHFSLYQANDYHVLGFSGPLKQYFKSMEMLSSLIALWNSYSIYNKQKMILVNTGVLTSLVIVFWCLSSQLSFMAFWDNISVCIKPITTWFLTRTW